MHCNYSYISRERKPSPPANTSAKMTSISNKDPHVLLERTWDDKTKLPEKQKFSGDNDKKAEVHFDSGSLGIEFFYKKKLPDFIHAGNKLQWNWIETFSKL